MTTCPTALIPASTFRTAVGMNMTTVSQVSSLGKRCATTSEIQRANTTVWIENITTFLQNKVQNATNSKKSEFLFTRTYTGIMKTAQQQTALNEIGHVKPVHSKCTGLLTKDVLLLHYNAHPHTPV
jgi:hypothetical protein